MYRILTFVLSTWAERHDTRYDCLEDALEAVPLLEAEATPWRIQVWIDVRMGPAEAGFWTDERYWIDGQP